MKNAAEIMMDLKVDRIREIDEIINFGCLRKAHVDILKFEVHGLLKDIESSTLESVGYEVEQRGGDEYE